MYPAEFEGVLDHDVQSSGIKIPDFQVSDVRSATGLSLLM